MSDAPPPPAAKEPLKGGELINTVGFWRIVGEDFRQHRKKILLPGFQALFVYRFGTWADTIKFRPFALVMKAVYYAAYVFVRNIYGIEFEKTIKAGRRIELGHQNGMVIHKFAEIGDDVLIRHNVTFGAGVEWTHLQGPKIGSNVTFSPGVVVVGNVTIGDNVSIGPNCVITSDVPSGRTLFVPPPRALPKPDRLADTPEQKTGISDPPSGQNQKE